MTQLDLPLGWPADASEGAFLVGEANAHAVHHLDHRGAWPVMAAIVTGPRKSGRSLLARITAAQARGDVIDDAERQPEADIFHAWNRAQAERSPLIIVADVAPPDWRVGLADLRSRLAATPAVRIAPPDDALATALLERFFERRGIVASGEAVRWIVRRVERSYVALIRIVEAIEEGIQGRGNRRLSTATAGTILASTGLLSGARLEEEA